jgi:hypothetical protein
MKKILPLTIAALFLTSGCAPKSPISSYVEVNSSQSGMNIKILGKFVMAGHLLIMIF